MITETIYLNRDNVISVEMLANGAAQDITGTSRIKLKIGETVIDSKYHLSVFDWDTNGSSGQLDMTLGHQKIPVGNYVARLVVYDTTYPNGIEWDAGIVLHVKEAVI